MRIPFFTQRPPSHDKALLLQAVKVLEEARLAEEARKAKEAELEALVSTPLNFKILRDLINAAGDKIVKVTLLSGETLTIAPYDAYERTRQAEAVGRDLA